LGHSSTLLAGRSVPHKRFNGCSSSLVTQADRRAMHSVARGMQPLRSQFLRRSAGKSSTRLSLNNLGRPIEEFRTLNLGCAYLPQLLLRSSATSELITFLRGGRFERASVNYNYKYDSVRARFHNFEMEELVPNVMKAIQNYLESCDPVYVPRNQRLGLGTANVKEKGNIDEGVPRYDGLQYGNKVKNEKEAKRLAQGGENERNDGAQRSEKQRRLD